MPKTALLEQLTQQFPAFPETMLTEAAQVLARLTPEQAAQVTETMQKIYDEYMKLKQQLADYEANAVKQIEEFWHQLMHKIEGASTQEDAAAIDKLFNK